jgi:hypothetical protein
VAEFKLEVGKPRFGWLIDGDKSTPLVQAVLEDTGTSIVLRVCWSRDAKTTHLQRWFTGKAIQWGDDPDGTHFRYSVPDVLWFQDVDGSATLVHARAIRSRTNMHFGEGAAIVTYAILGTGGADYRAINGFRSEITGLLDWFGQGSVRDTPAFDSEGRLTSLAIELKPPAPTKLARKMNLCVRPHFSTTSEPSGDWRIHETALIETRTARPRPVRDHAEIHGSVRDLLGVATWQRCGYDAQWAHRTNDPNRAMSGKSFGDRWAPMRSYQSPAGEPRTQRLRYMFQFDDIGQGGFARWAHLRAKFSRGINPMMATLDGRNAGLEACLSLSCVGLDGIGYQLALDSGASKAQANRETHRARFERVAATLIVPPPMEINEWSQRASDASNGIKHANRDMPDVLTMANTLRENCLLFRIWVAGRIGVSRAIITHALQIDPMSSPYEIVD